MSATGSTPQVLLKRLFSSKSFQKSHLLIRRLAEFQSSIENNCANSFQTYCQIQQLHCCRSPACHQHQEIRLQRRCYHAPNHHLHHNQPNYQHSCHIQRGPRSVSSQIGSYSLISHHSHFSSSSHSDGSNVNILPTQDQQDRPLPDPFKLVAKELRNLSPDIWKELSVEPHQLQEMSRYYFDGRGKMFRPMVGLLMAKACNQHSNKGEGIMESQKVVAMVSEMVHTASLVHDDVIDASDTRRGQQTLNKMHGQRQSVLTGDFILSQATIALARTGNPKVISLLASVLADLVSGEFMQLGSKEDENERFQHYLKKTYKKTASLIANSCKAVAVLSEVDEDIADLAFQYGRNLGIAFQLVDDLLDFVSSQQIMGKPTAADLRLGLATAPVLFAAMQHRELQPMIMRRFSEEGDVEYTRAMVDKSDGVEQTKMLAARHSSEAIKNLSQFSPSPAQQALVRLAQLLLDRNK